MKPMRLLPVPSTEDTVDPMIERKQKIQQEARQLKIERTGLTQSYCHSCKKDVPIERFDLHRTGDKSRKEKKITHRKNTPEKLWKPRRECNKCIRERQKLDGTYENQKATATRRYHSSSSAKEVYKNAARRARSLLSDSYIKKLLRSVGYTNEQITNDVIISKRIEIKKRRDDVRNNPWQKKKANGYYNNAAAKSAKKKSKKRAVEELKPYYIKRLIRRSIYYKGEEITQEMIDKKIKEIERMRCVRTVNKIKSKKKKPETFNGFHIPADIRLEL